VIADAAKALGRRFGVEISHHRPAGARRAARLHKYEIQVVADVGANVGQYASELRRFGYKGLIVSFEPLSSAFAELGRRAAGDPLWECHQVALGDEDTQRAINVASNLASSSFLPMRDEHRRAAPQISYGGTERVEVRRLDSYELAISTPAMLKLDVQGFEDRVLAGASETLPRISLIECELSIAMLYEGQPSFGSMMERFSNLAFEMIDLDPGFHDPRDGRILSVDATFSRP
jgi:FkbM family methyltransferase